MFGVCTKQRSKVKILIKNPTVVDVIGVISTTCQMTNSDTYVCRTDSSALLNCLIVGWHHCLSLFSVAIMVTLLR